MYLAWRRFLPLSLNYLLFFVGIKCFIFCHSVLIQVYKLIEDLDFFHKVFKTLGFFCSFLTFNLLFCFIVLLFLGLLCNMRSILLLGFALLRYMGLLLFGLPFMFVGSLNLLLFKIILG